MEDKKYKNLFEDMGNEHDEEKLQKSIKHVDKRDFVNEQDQ